MLDIVDIDAELIRYAHQNFWLDIDDVSAGPGLDGRDQILYTENRRWVGRIDFLRMDFTENMKANVVGDRLRGRANKLRVQICNRGTLRYLGDEARFYEKVGVPEGVVAQGHISFDDGTAFSDGSGFALPGHAEPTALEAMPAGASMLRLDGYIGRSIAVGAFFSVNDFLYRVEKNDNGKITFNPPLRESVGKGVMVEVSAPKVQVRLQDKSDWRPFCEYFKFGEPLSVNVVEAFDR